MVHAHICYRWRRGVRLLVLVPAVAMAWILPAPSCSGVVLSQCDWNCELKWCRDDRHTGRLPARVRAPAGGGTGRKVG